MQPQRKPTMHGGARRSTNVDRRPRPLAHLKGLALAVLLAGAASAAPAAPFIPASDAEVVQKLPTRLDGAARAQRVALASQPQDLPMALATARAAIDRARQHGDPRELGLAQAALAPWWKAAEPPPAARLLRATVLQSQHEFAAALADLEPLANGSASAPLAVHAQAALTRVSVLQVTGDLAQAAQACNTLADPRFATLGAGLSMPARACAAELRSLRGESRQAADALAALAREAPANGWLAIVRAELAERMGDDALAEAQYRAALARGGDVYAVAAYADWLLDRGRHADVLALLKLRDEDADALLLRRAIAGKRLGSAQAAADAATLHARFDAARQRGENFHQREQARLALDLDGDAPRALELALANWQRQKEPADAVLLHRAALAAGQPAAAAPVQQLRAAGWADVRLTAPAQGV